jgi:hypothetical protein
MTESQPHFGQILTSMLILANYKTKCRQGNRVIRVRQSREGFLNQAKPRNIRHSPGRESAKPCIPTREIPRRARCSKCLLQGFEGMALDGASTQNPAEAFVEFPCKSLKTPRATKQICYVGPAGETVRHSMRSPDAIPAGFARHRTEFCEIQPTSKTTFKTYCSRLFSICETFTKAHCYRPG